MSDLRLRRAALSSAMSGVSRLSAVICSFLIIPIVSGYLSKTEFGIWVLITSLSALLSFSDLGVGNGIINAVSRKFGENDLIGIRRVVGASYVALILISTILFSIFYFIILLCGIEKYFGIKDPGDIVWLKSAVVIFVSVYFVSLPVNVVLKVQIAIQKGYITSFYSMLGALLSLLLVMIGVSMKVSFVWLVFLFVAPGVVAQLINSFVFYFWNGSEYIPKFTFSLDAEVKCLLKNGLAFLFLQLIFGILASIDVYLISMNYGPSEVGDYSIAAKLFSAITFIYGIILQPLWPAYREAMITKNFAWVRRTHLRTLILLATISLLYCSLISGLFQQLTFMWIGSEVNVENVTLVGFSLAFLIEGLVMAHATLLNAMGSLWPQIYIGCIYVVCSVLMKSYIIDSFGIAYIPYITASLNAIVVLSALYFVAKDNLKNNRIGE